MNPAPTAAMIASEVSIFVRRRHPNASPATGVPDDSRKNETPKFSRKLKYKEQQEWESMEANILTAEEKVSALEAIFAAPDFYTKSRAEMAELENQLRNARDAVAHLYARWHELDLLQKKS